MGFFIFYLFHSPLCGIGLVRVGEEFFKISMPKVLLALKELAIGSRPGVMVGICRTFLA